MPIEGQAAIGKSRFSTFDTGSAARERLGAVFDLSLSGDPIDGAEISARAGVHRSVCLNKCAVENCRRWSFSEGEADEHG